MSENQFRIAGIQNIKSAMDRYSSSSADFFSLKEDGESSKVRFVHGDSNDLDIFVVHKVLYEGKEKYILCLGPINQPCPCCESVCKPQMRLFLTLDEIKDGKRKIWDRGKGEIPNMLEFITRYGNLNSIYYEIVRHGKKGDQKTTYQFFPIPEQNMPPQEPRESLVTTGFLLQKTAEELKDLISTGKIVQAPNRFGGDGGNGGNRSFQPQGGGGVPQKMF